MLSILVVDDHKEEREGIAFLINELGFPSNCMLQKTVVKHLNM